MSRVIPDPSCTQTQVDDQGFITLRFIGAIEAQGLTESGLAQQIKDTCIREDIYPVIDVSVTVTQRFIHVEGEVLRPGRALWSPNLTLTKAIQKATGFSIFAKRSTVVLTRDEQTYAVDAKEALRNPGKDVKVYLGDSLNIPRSPY